MKHYRIILCIAAALALFPFELLSGCAHSNPNTTAPATVATVQPPQTGMSQPAPAATAASAGFFAKVKAWWNSPSPAVAAIKTETASLLKTAVFAAGKDKLAGANWADSAAAGIYAARDQIAADPTQLNALLGNYLPANSTWTTVIDGLVSRLITGQLNTADQRRAALDGIAQTLTTTAATQRAAQ